MNIIQTKGLSSGSIFKFLFCGSFVLFFLFGLGCGIAALLGYNALTLNEQHIYGIAGLLGGIVLGVLLPIIFSILFWIILFIGSRLWSLFFGPLTFKFKE